MRSICFLLVLVAVLPSHSLYTKKGVKNDPAVGCDPAACQLPDCCCASTTPPLDPSEMPQIVMMSFDDDLNSQLYYAYYSPLMQHTNQNGCPIGMTYFLSHDYTDYSLVNTVWKRGAEIASHSISSHLSPTRYWATLDYQGWIDEMVGLTQIASTFANMSIEDIVGARSPSLQIEGDVMMQALYDSGFQYDSSMPTQQWSPPLFPYTFDYKMPPNCEMTQCPVDSYPGMWEMPMVDFNDSQNFPCSMLDACPSTNTTNATYQFLLYNFNLHYTSNKAPFGLFTHAAWFETDPSHYPGYAQFIEYVLTLPDVYIVTFKQAIEWMRNPTPLSDIGNFEPWSCAILPNRGCSPVTECYYADSPPGGSRYMTICGSCPPNYPWVGNPYGQ